MKTKLTLLFALLLFSFAAFSGTTHTIVFSFNYYSPDSLNVNVGDEIIWSGSFIFHPLASTSVPAGVAPFGNMSGTSYSYIIPAAGTYRFHCSLHDFKGVIIAGGATDIKETGLISEMSIYPNPASDVVTISIDEAMIGSTATITDVTGRMMTAVSLTTRHSLLTTHHLPNGVYFVTIESGKQNVTQKLIITK